MTEFSTKGDARYTAPEDWLIRLVMCGVPTLTFTPGHFLMSAAIALWLGAMDGFARWWGSCNSRALLATPEGLCITSSSSPGVVPWRNVLGIRNWHHVNRFDYVAVYYRRAGRLEVATCLDQSSEDELRAFICACTEFVTRDAPRLSITLPGLCEPGVHRPLFRRFMQDVALATVVGFAFGAVGRGFAFGVFAALQSSVVAALRYPIRTTTLVQKEGLWCSPSPDARPLRLIPRALQLWVRGLAEAAYRNQASGTR